MVAWLPPSASVMPQACASSTPQSRSSFSTSARGGAEPDDSVRRSVENFLPVRASQSVRMIHMVGTPQVTVTRSPSSSS